MENVSDAPRARGGAKTMNDLAVPGVARGDGAAARQGGDENVPAAVAAVNAKAAGERLSGAVDEKTGSGPPPQARAPAYVCAIGAEQQGQQQRLQPFRERNVEDGKRLIPPHIKVPPKKLFGYPERYRSPTDAMVSPVSRGLLTRNRRPGRTLAPVVPPKALENTFQETVGEALEQKESQ